MGTTFSESLQAAFPAVPFCAGGLYGKKCYHAPGLECNPCASLNTAQQNRSCADPNLLRRHEGLCFPSENSLARRIAVINLIPHDPLRQSRNDHSAARYARQAAVAIAGGIGE